MSTQNPEVKDYPIVFNAVYQEKMSRLTTFFRLFMIIPHMIVLYFIAIAVSFVLFVSWFAILFTGKFPKGMWDFTVGYMRWMTRVTSYEYLLTDKYPPFSMD
jgi:ABC-type multidrug transport system permease subunit